MNNQSKNHYLIIAFLIIASGLVAYFLLWPFSEQLKENSILAAAKEKELAQKQQKLNDLKELSTDFAKKGGELKDLELAMPKEAQIPEILVQLESIIGESGLAVSNLSPKKEDKEKKVEVGLDVKGDYGNIIKLIEILQNNFRPVSIDEINIAKSDSEEEGQVTTVMEFSLTVSFPYQGEEEAPVAAEANQTVEEEAIQTQ